MISTTKLNERFSLRNALRNVKHHNSTSSIPEADLTIEKEPELHATIKAMAAEIVADPDLILAETYTPEDLARDWNRLQKENFLTPQGEIGEIGSRARVGHYVIDKHMPHFHDVQNHHGRSVRNSISQEALEKALHMNVRGHSTPYASEIRKMITMGLGLGSVTKYRAKVAKTIVRYFAAQRVLDPCAGWGGRMLGAIAAGATYMGCDPDPRTAAGLRAILADPSIPAPAAARATVIEKPCEKALVEDLQAMEPFDMILTSPPYFNLELYTAGEQSTVTHPTWDSWVTDWLKPVILGCLARLKEGGVSCWSVKDFRTDKAYGLVAAVTAIHKEAGFTLVKTVKMQGVGRMGINRINDEGKATRKSEEDTYCFRFTDSAVVEAEEVEVEDLTTLSRAELIAKCKERKIKGYSSKTRAELITLLQS